MVGHLLTRRLLGAFIRHPQPGPVISGSSCTIGSRARVLHMSASDRSPHCSPLPTTSPSSWSWSRDREFRARQLASSSLPVSQPFLGPATLAPRPSMCLFRRRDLVSLKDDQTIHPAQICLL